MWLWSTQTLIPIILSFTNKTVVSADSCGPIKLMIQTLGVTHRDNSMGLLFLLILFMDK